MAAVEEELRLKTNLKSFKDVSKLGKVKLNQICKSLGVDIEKSFGKKALVNVVCNALGISTSSIEHDSNDEVKVDISSNTPLIAQPQKLKKWKKSLLSIPQLMDEALVKEFLLGVGYSQTDVRKYKTLRAWQHKQGIHSVKLRGDCSHVDALLFVLCDIVSEGKTTIPPDPTCTELPCCWTNPKGTCVDPVTIEQVHFYKSRFGEQTPTKKFRATPSVSEEFFGVASNKKAVEVSKQHLKMAVLAANCDKPMPPVYYLLKNNYSEPEFKFTETCELPSQLMENDPRLLPSYVTDIEATPPVAISSENDSLPQCESSSEIGLPLAPVTPFCENGTFNEENMFQPPIIYPVQVPSIPPLNDSALEFYNNNVKVSINQYWEIEKATRSQSSSELWFKERQLRVTASNFGNIIKRKKADVSKLTNRLSTTCNSLSHLNTPGECPLLEMWKTIA
ncbi:hypothetical protein ACROYT_G000807 [Oculina patagonica]